MTNRFQFRIRTLLILFIVLGVYITLFRLYWHWMTLLTTAAIPLWLTLLVVRRWTKCGDEKRTWLRGTLWTALAVVIWVPWLVILILGPGEEIYGIFEDLFPDEWNRVWGR